MTEKFHKMTAAGLVLWTLLALTGRIVPELEHEVLTMTEPADA